MSTEDQNLKRSRITNSLLSLIDKIPNGDEVNDIERVVEESSSLNRKQWIIILGILGSLASIISLTLIFNPKDNVEQLTVFVTDAKGNAVLEYKGELNIPIGNRILNRKIESGGRTNFGDITADNIGDTIIIGLKAEGWEIEGTNTFAFQGEPIKLIVKRDNSLGLIKGSVMTRDGQSFIDSANITINGDTVIYSNKDGLFEIILPQHMTGKV